MELGRIVNRHGIRGEVRIRPHNPATTAFEQLDEIEVHWPDGRSETRPIESSRPHKNCILVRFGGVVTANDAEALIGCTVHARPEDLPGLDPGEYYASDLIGCTVQTDTGIALGTVIEVMNAGSSDILVVVDGKTEVLIPLIDDLCPQIEIAKKQIVITPIDGLLDEPS